jgi:hypothetical protein
MPFTNEELRNIVRNMNGYNNTNEAELAAALLEARENAIIEKTGAIMTVNKFAAELLAAQEELNYERNRISTLTIDSLIAERDRAVKSLGILSGLNETLTAERDRISADRDIVRAERDEAVRCLRSTLDERDELAKELGEAQEVVAFALDAFEHRKMYLYDEVAKGLRAVAQGEEAGK